MFLAVKHLALAEGVSSRQIYRRLKAGWYYRWFKLGPRMSRIAENDMAVAGVSPALPLTQLRPRTLVTVRRAARYLTISRKRVYQLIDERQLAAVRLGPRAIRIEAESIMDFIASRRMKREGE